jgi:hypothetical protein
MEHCPAFKCPNLVRLILLIAATLLTGCDHGFEFHPEDLTPQQMVDRAELIFVGMIEGQHVDSYPFFDVAVPPGVGTGFWRPLRRRVRVEAVLRGTYAKPKMDVFEVFWMGGGSLSWNGNNVTREGERVLFMVRRESGRWRIVRDFRRSIYPVQLAHLAPLPMDESRPFWERYALMNYRIEGYTPAPTGTPFYWADPGQALDAWRTKKLLRGLLRHPVREVRLAACEELAHESDECWEMLSDPKVSEGALVYRAPIHWDEQRLSRTRSDFKPALEKRTMDQLRILTTVGHLGLRREFCRIFTEEFPGDTDNGCPADKPIPATIVTQVSDVPLLGEWPIK